MGDCFGESRECDIKRIVRIGINVWIQENNRLIRNRMIHITSIDCSFDNAFSASSRDSSPCQPLSRTFLFTSLLLCCLPHLLTNLICLSSFLGHFSNPLAVEEENEGHWGACESEEGNKCGCPVAKMGIGELARTLANQIRRLRTHIPKLAYI